MLSFIRQKLFHGTNNKETVPTFDFIKHKLKRHDFGPGFYTTFSIEASKEWSTMHDSLKCYVLEYRLSNKYEILDLTNNSDKDINIWLGLLCKYRSPESGLTPQAKNVVDYFTSQIPTDYEDYDIVIGYRADDSYFNYLRGFLNNQISIETLKKAIYLGNLGLQVFLKSEKAINSLILSNTYIVNGFEYKKKSDDRNNEANFKYQEILKNDTVLENPTYASDIIKNN